MPKALEDKLKKEAKSKGLTGKRAGAYVFGTLRKTGWKPMSAKTIVGHRTNHHKLPKGI